MPLVPVAPTDASSWALWGNAGSSVLKFSRTRLAARLASTNVCSVSTAPPATTVPRDHTPKVTKTMRAAVARPAEILQRSAAINMEVAIPATAAKYGDQTRIKIDG